jgi:hypothetical protein
MYKLLNRIKSGPSLLVLLLITLSFYSAFTTKSHPQATSLKKNFRPTRILPPAVLDFKSTNSETESDDLETNIKFVLPGTLNLGLSSSYKSIHNSLDTFAFIKVPLLYFLFDIPPPAIP